MKLSTLCTFACVVATSLSLTGCNSIGAKYPTIGETSDPFDYLTQYVEADEAGLINPYRALDLEGHFILKDNSDHTYWKRVWCSKTNLSRFENEIRNVCNANGGDLINSFCVHSKSKNILFETSVRYYNLCSNKGGVTVTGYFPKRGVSYTDSAWQKFVGPRKADEDFKIATQQRKEKQRAKQRAQEENKRQALKKQENKYLLSPEAKGTKVCRKERKDAVAIGYVEDFGPKKIKINVVFLGYPPNLTLGGFQPHTVWDYPNNWYVCE